MENIKIATAQFEVQSGDKLYNLDVIERLSADASRLGAHVISFQECSITGLTHAMNFSRGELTDQAEFVPGGPSIERLKQIAYKNNIVILAGLFEKTADGKLYKAHVCVGKNGVIAKFRKLHPFINPYLSPGDQYCIFNLYGWKCGILICYDNNIIENVRTTNLLGADILFMPHVTMCTPSPRPGAGFVDHKLWTNRETDPTSLRIEFDGLKGREWLMKWLPARAYDNGMYVVFSNAIGNEGGQIKNGCSMILDPYGDILAECRNLGDDVVVTSCSPDKLRLAGGYRYKNARKVELFSEVITKTHISKQEVAWKSS
jgi:predicted amidohydrolase